LTYPGTCRPIAHENQRFNLFRELPNIVEKLDSYLLDVSFLFDSWLALLASSPARGFFFSVLNSIV